MIDSTDVSFFMVSQYALYFLLFFVTFGRDPPMSFSRLNI